LPFQKAGASICFSVVTTHNLPRLASAISQHLKSKASVSELAAFKIFLILLPVCGWM